MNDQAKLLQKTLFKGGQGTSQNDQAKLALDQQRLNEQTNVQRERIQSQEDIANMRAQIALQRQQQKPSQGRGN